MEKDQNYSSRCFETYRDTHGDDGIQLEEAYKEMQLYYNCYYKKHFEKINNDAKILEIGCNAGYMLKVFENAGYNNLTGIDLSPKDVEIAQKSCGGGIHVYCVDAFEYLKNTNDKYDVIFTRAVMEHIKKERIFEFLSLINEALTDEGIVLIDVPNMDWIWASHERYMDFTHEVGFTMESLRQVMRQFFDDVKVEFVDDTNRYHSIKSFFARTIMCPLLFWIDMRLPKEHFINKGILGVGRKHISND